MQAAAWLSTITELCSLWAAAANLFDRVRSLPLRSATQYEITFHPVAGGPARILKMQQPPRDGGQAIEL